MKPTTTYGLLGVAALGVVSLVHFARDLALEGPPIYRYVLGVLPNTAAAVALPFAFMSVWSQNNPLGTFAASRRWFTGACVVSCCGLIAWEYLQPSRGRVFDLHDIGATCIGIGVAWLLFHVLAAHRAVA